MGQGGGVRTYAPARRFKVFLTFAGVFFLVLVAGVAWTIAMEPQPGPVVAFFVLWIAFVGGAIVWALTRIPTRITVAEDVIRFRTVLRSFEVPVKTVASVKPRWNDPFGNMPCSGTKGAR
jgi:hypothetical protein